MKKIVKILLVLVTWGPWVIPQGVGAEQPKVYLDIYSPAIRRFPIALPEFKDMGADRNVSQMAKGVPEVLGNDLELTGLFRILDPILFLEDPKAGITKEETDFSAWMAIGAEALVKGGIYLKGDELKIEFRLFDVFQQRQITGVRYNGSPQEWRRMAHKFANEIMYRLTGEEGAFDTMISFVGDVGGAKEIFVMDYDGYNLKRLTRTGSINLSPSWSPEGDKLLFTSYMSGNPDLYLLNLRGGDMTRLAGFAGLNIGGRWSPKGDKITLTLTKDGNPDIYTMKPDGSGLKRLTNHWGIDVSSVFSPDGKQIAFVSDRSGSPQVYIMNADGSNVRRLTFEGNYNTTPVWSPRGDKVAFTGGGDGGFSIFLINPDGTGLVRLTDGSADDRYPSFSPDGRFIVYSSRRGGKSRLYIVNVNGSYKKRIEVPLDASHPSWSPRLK